VTFQELGGIGEFIGGIGVIVSLLSLHVRFETAPESNA
jgi:hypothetical protein